MSVLDDILDDAQPGYETQVGALVARLHRDVGTAHFEGITKGGLILHVVRLLEPIQGHSQLVLQLLSDLASLSWWCGLPIDDETAAAMSALTRRVHYDDSRAIQLRDHPPSPLAMRRHALFIGSVVNRLHSPTRGAFEYIRALAADPDCEAIDVFHQGPLTPELVEYGIERLSSARIQPSFHCMDDDPDFILKAVQNGPRTFHFWCEGPALPHISLCAMFGPTVMFTCGDAAPVQYADAYWYNQDAGYIADLWRRRGAPEAFISNYRRLESVCFNLIAPVTPRSRAHLGIGHDDVVLTTAGNRLGIDFDQAFVDGIAGLLLSGPKLKWVVAGRLQDFWINAFSQVLGDQFIHVPFDADLASLLGLTDIFANPFRAGGGNTAIMAIDAGSVVLTRDDMGDVGAFVPDHHRAKNADTYFAMLKELIDDPALRAARLAEQQALQCKRLDQDLFARELKDLVALAYKRFGARRPMTLEAIYAQTPQKGAKASRGR